MTTDLATAPRWQRPHDKTWTHPCRGEAHVGLFDIALTGHDMRDALSA